MLSRWLRDGSLLVVKGGIGGDVVTRWLDGEPWRVLSHPCKITALATDGNIVVLGDERGCLLHGSIERVEACTGTLIGPVTALCILGDDTIVAGGSDGQLAVVQGGHVEIMKSCIPETVTALLCQDGLLYVGTESGAIHVMDSSFGHRAKLLAHTAPVSMIVGAPSGAIFSFSNDERLVYRWTEGAAAVMYGGLLGCPLAISPRRDGGLAVLGEDGSLCIYGEDCKQPSRIVKFAEQRRPVSLQWVLGKELILGLETRDGKIILTNPLDNTEASVQTLAKTNVLSRTKVISPFAPK